MTKVFFERKREVSTSVSLFEEKLAILANTRSFLKENPTQFGCCACQLGINKRIASVRWKDAYIDLINPVVISSEEYFAFNQETCFDLPDIIYSADRYRGFIIDRETIDGRTTRIQQEYYYVDGRYEDLDGNNVGVYVQQMINLMDGLSPKAFEINKNIKKQNRNDPCACGSGKKYKKCCMA